MKLLPALILICLPAQATPLEMCYNGVNELATIYQGHEIIYCYNPLPTPGHVWCIIDGQAVDSYYGQVEGEYWYRPQFTYESIAELDRGIVCQTGYSEVPVESGNWIKQTC